MSVMVINQYSYHSHGRLHEAVNYSGFQLPRWAKIKILLQIKICLVGPPVVEGWSSVCRAARVGNVLPAPFPQQLMLQRLSAVKVASRVV